MKFIYVKEILGTRQNLYRTLSERGIATCHLL